LRPTMCESMATVGFLELEIWCTKVCIYYENKTSRVWRHRVMWRHRWRHHSI